MSRYTCYPITQFDSSGYAAWNCVAATTAELVDMVTVGRVRVSAAAIRNASGVRDQRGLLLSEAADAAVRLTGVVLQPRFLKGDGTQRGKLRDLVAAGRPLSVMIDTNVTAGTDFRTGGRTYTFRGLHQVSVRLYRWQELEKPHAEFDVEDPGDQPDQSWRFWPADLLYRAAERAGGGGIWILMARDTEGVTRYARQRARFRARPTTASADLGPVRIGKGYFVKETGRGGTWLRANGTKAVGWHHTGAHGWVKGEALA